MAEEEERYLNRYGDEDPGEAPDRESIGTEGEHQAVVTQAKKRKSSGNKNTKPRKKKLPKRKPTVLEGEHAA